MANILTLTTAQSAPFKGGRGITRPHLASRPEWLAIVAAGAISDARRGQIGWQYEQLLCVAKGESGSRFRVFYCNACARFKEIQTGNLRGKASATKNKQTHCGCLRSETFKTNIGAKIEHEPTERLQKAYLLVVTKGPKAAAMELRVGDYSIRAMAHKRREQVLSLPLDTRKNIKVMAEATGRGYCKARRIYGLTSPEVNFPVVRGLSAR